MYKDNINNRLAATIKACVENGQRLLEDSIYLNEYDRFPSAKVLAMLAQEEFAKAYIVRLAQEGAFPWCDEIIWATQNHRCKQLMFILMEYLFTPLSDAKSMLDRDKIMQEKYPNILLPKKVADALNIFCYENIKRRKSQSWCWAELPKYDAEAKKIWKGKVERTKHNALYVSVGNDGRVTNIPKTDAADASQSIEYAEILKEVACGHDVYAFTEKECIKSILKEILGNIVHG
jgi:AbiV family abortive infection protein